MLIQEPIYETIYFNKLEKEVINTPLFQRLRYIGQLSGVFFVYPSANHTRFSHSLGATYIAGQYAEHLFPNDNKKFQLIRLSALLHDISHGPFSHDFDHAVYEKIYNVEKGHDVHRLFLIKYFDSIFKKYNINYKDIIDIWEPKSDENQIMKDIIQGSLGADRIDYLLRDNYFSGCKLISFSWKRFVCHSEIKNNKLVYPIKLLNEIYLFFILREEMYNKVYRHKTSIKVSLMSKEMLENCIDDLNLIERVQDIEKFIYINDYFLTGEIMNLNDNHISKKILKELYNRNIKNYDGIQNTIDFKKIYNQLKLINWKEENYLVSIDKIFKPE